MANTPGYYLTPCMKKIAEKKRNAMAKKFKRTSPSIFGCISGNLCQGSRGKAKAVVFTVIDTVKNSFSRVKADATLYQAA